MFNFKNIKLHLIFNSRDLTKYLVFVIKIFS